MNHLCLSSSRKPDSMSYRTNLFTSVFIAYLAFFDANLSFFSFNRVLSHPCASWKFTKRDTRMNTGRLLVTRHHPRHVTRLKLHRACNYRASVSRRNNSHQSAVGSGRYLLVTAASCRLCCRVYNRSDRIDPRFPPRTRDPSSAGFRRSLSSERNMRRIHVVTSTRTSAEKSAAELLRRVRELIK